MEEVGFFVAEQVEPGAGGEEVVGGLREIETIFAVQKGFELLPDGVQVEHIRGGVGLLFLSERFGAPVAGLLLLGEFDASEVFGEVFQAVTVGVGADQAAGDFGADDGGREHAQAVIEGGDVEAGEMEEFLGVWVGEEGFQVRAVWALAAQNFGDDLDEVGGAVAGRKLHQTEAVAMRVEAHGFGVDGDEAAEIQVFGEVVLMEGNVGGHGASVATTTSRRRAKKRTEPSMRSMRGDMEP